MIHIYQGFCPDELQPNSRDPNCPACQVETERKHLRAEVTRLTAENERLTATNKSLMAELREERGYISFDD